MEHNFYEMLELPLEPLVTDTSGIPGIIETRKKEWNKLINALPPDKGVLYKRKRDLLPEALKLLTQPDKLRQLGKEALKNAQKEVLDAFCIIAGSRASITESEFATLCQSNPKLKPETIRSMAVQACITITKDEEAQSGVPVKPQLPDDIKIPSPHVLNEIESYLEAMGVATIYEFLKCTPTVSNKALLDAAKKLKNKRDGSAKSDAINSLGMHAKKLFESEQSKKGFDYAWANYQATKKIKLDYYVTGTPRSISREKYLQLIDKLREFGMSKEDAEWYAYDECCNKRKAPFPAPQAAEAKAPERVQCPNCYMFNDTDARRCSHCNNWLVIECPKCHKPARAGRKACSCGFPLQDLPIATLAINEAKEAARNGNMEEALRQLGTALLYWPGNKEALAFESAIKGEIAQQQLKRLEASLKLLLSPQQAKAQAAASGIKLTWGPAIFRGRPVTGDSVVLESAERVAVTYKLIRKEGGIPATESDGTVVVNTAATAFEDTAVKPGQVYGYSVFACLEKQAVPMGAPCGKARVLPSPEGLAVSPGDGILTLSWPCAGGAERYIIVRKEGGVPQNLQDGTRIEVSGSDNMFVDKGLENGKRYGYLFACAYAALDGGGHELSGAASASAVPVCPPPALLPADWEAGVRQDVLELHWKPLADADAQVQWYLTDEIPAPAGSILTIGAPQLRPSERLADVDRAACSAKVKADFSGRKHLTPVVEKNGAAMVCTSRPVVALPSVSALMAQRMQDRVVLTWKWPDKCNEVAIAYGTSAYPISPDDPGKAGVVRCTRSQYDREKAYILRASGNVIYYFSVFAVLATKDGTFNSSPATVLSAGAAAKKRISYELKCKKTSFFFGKKVWSLDISMKGGSLPRLELRTKRGAQPLNHNDGLHVMWIEEDGLSVKNVPIPAEFVEPGACIRLFLADASGSEVYTLDRISTDALTIR